jgi:hypothetical protein
MKKKISERVALALARANRLAGQPIENCDAILPVEVRAANLLADSPWGPYVVEGDPYEWGHGRASATILLEQKGHKGDCHVPMDYYDGGIEVSCRASEILGDHFIEFVNAGVACVYEV